MKIEGEMKKTAKCDFFRKKSVTIKILKSREIEILLGITWSHFIVTRGSVSRSCATTPHPSCFSKS